MNQAPNMAVPEVTFKTRVRDETVEGPNPFRWQDVQPADIFAGKKVIVFALPGALRRPVPARTCPGLSQNTTNSRNWVSMKSTA